LTIVLITHEHDIAEYGTRTVNVLDGRITADHAVQKRREAAQEILALPPPDTE
jgi:putative ABC transport system ATP-binding protein